MVNRELIRRALEIPTPATMQALINDNDTVFLVDWREEEEAIVEYCESILQTGSLVSEFEDSDSEAGFEMYLRYQDRRLRVPLVIGLEDRHIALCSLNEILAPDYELRYCNDGYGSDTNAVLALPTSHWRHLEQEFGEKVQKRFDKIVPGNKPT